MLVRPNVRALSAAAVLAAALLGSACPAASDTPKHLAPIPAATLALMTAQGTTASAPILMRSFKKEAELEVWKRNRDGRFVHVKTFPICRWSGQLGPKLRTGDRQAPEGFYQVAPKQMNPNSVYHRSFDLGYPNALARAHGATGSYLMVHGVCSSMGCFAMTDRAVGEIYAIAREAFAGGQATLQFQSYPFRMTAANMARHRTDPNIGFWRQLKEGFDRLEATGEEPLVGVSGKRYVFAPYRDPAKEAAASERRAEEEKRIATLVEEGVAAVRTTYADGGQHASFTALLRKGADLGLLSRPEALPFAGREVVVIAARRKPACPGGPGCATQVASGAAPAPGLFSEVEPWVLAPMPIEEIASGLMAGRALAAPVGPRTLPAFVSAVAWGGTTETTVVAAGL